MNEALEKLADGSNVRRLSDAIRQVRNDLADRDDVVVDLREAQRARLDLLAAELAGVIAEVPEDHRGFDFAISSGTQPRFWIDAVAHVVMGRDRRSYRFVRDTRAGRAVLAESTEIGPVADAVTRYVAERIVERQRWLEAADAPDADEATGEADRSAAARRGGGLGAFLANLALLLVGVAAGAALTLAFLRDRVPELQTFF